VFADCGYLALPRPFSEIDLEDLQTANEHRLPKILVQGQLVPLMGSDPEK
jgi:hypothetical protein